MVQLVQFIRHRRFLYLSWVWCSRCSWCSSGAVGAVHQTPKISLSQLSLVQLVQLQVQFKKAKILNWHRRFPYLSWVWCSWCSWCSKFFKPYKIYFWNFENWNWHNFLSKSVHNKNTLSHTIFHYVMIFFCINLIFINFVY